MENKVGKFIADTRKGLGITQQQLANKLCISDKAVSKWERGVSLPDIGIIEKLAKELNVSVNEILAGKKDKNKDIIIQEEVDKIVNNINEISKKRRNKIIRLSLFLIGIIAIIMIFSIIGIKEYNKYNPKKIKMGENNYVFNNYLVEKKGLSGLESMVIKSEKATLDYNVSYLQIKLTKNGKLDKFTLSVNFFDKNKNYIGRGGYTYNDKKLIYTFVGKNEEASLLVESYSKNNNISYIGDQIKKIPLKNQLKVSDLKHYFLTYMPNTYLEWGTPIFDGRDNNKINVLSKKDYNSGMGGESSKGAYFVIRLNDGSSIATGQQYLYVFDSIDENIPVNPNYMMETDYYINNGKLMFTRDYGNTWIDADITSEQLNMTLNFYGDIALKTNSWFLSKNELIPIAYFYGEDPVLKISNDNGKTWSSHKFFTSSDVNGKQITHRVVGFTSQNFGYVALGTDWTMGSGELKKLYFTYDGGKSWNEVEIPLNGTSHVLYDICMYDEKVGVLLLRDSSNSNFPIIYSTISGGKSWNEVKYRDGNLPDEITYLNEVDSIEKQGEEYFIKLGQGNSGTLKATFRAVDMIGWLFMGTNNENIHTVG